MHPQILKVTAKKLIGLRAVMSLEQDATPQMWQAFMPRRKSVKNHVGADYLCVRSYRETGPKMFDPHTEFEKWAAVEVSDFSEVPEGMEALSIPGGRYAVFEHHGPATTFGDTMRYIFGSWLPSSKYMLDHRPHFEVLQGGYNPSDPDAREEVWVPLK
jgi:AraC family transcriptional regulator